MLQPLKKRADFNFVWLFAIIAGTAILVLSIYGAIRVGKTTSKLQDTEIAKTLSVITEPMQAGFAAGKKATITFKKDTVIDNFCSTGEFGFNELSVMTQERPNQDFESFGTPIKVTNKYIFSSDVPGKSFYVFSTPIVFAFKIADAIIIDSQEYCFIGLEEYEDYQNELSILGSKAKFGHQNCTENSLKVCFGYGGDCNITVKGDCYDLDCSNEYETGIVEKDGDYIEYVGNLIYPAIFSTKEVYECNLNRLMYRAHVLSHLFLEKSEIMSSRSCNTDLKNELIVLEDSFIDPTLPELKDIYIYSKVVRDKESREQCRLWS